MGVVLFKQPRLENPDLIASWPGIGNIGIIAADSLRGQLRAEELGEIEPWDFFYPTKVIIRNGVLTQLDFPGNKFYYKRLGNKDVIFFIGEEQPADGGRMYAEGKKAYEIANLVLDVATRFGCQRVFTSGAAVALTHHLAKPRVWAVASRKELLAEVKAQSNTVLMSETNGRVNVGSITGLNGLLLGLAKSKGLDAVCLMGEIPDYLSGAPFPYPTASRSVLEVLAGMLGVQLDFSSLDELAGQINGIVESIYEKLPPEVKERVEQRRAPAEPKPEAITEDDKKWIREHIDELFKRGRTGNDQPT